MPKANKESTSQLFHIVPKCSKKAEEINRCIIRAISVLMSEYPSRVDVNEIVYSSIDAQLSTRVIELLVNERILSGSVSQLTLTMTGYYAVKRAVRAEPQLAAALGETTASASSIDYTALLLGILRVHSGKGSI